MEQKTNLSPIGIPSKFVIFQPKTINVKPEVLPEHKTHLSPIGIPGRTLMFSAKGVIVRTRKRIGANFWKIIGA